MPRIDTAALDAELRQGRLRPVYFLVGEEHYLAQSALAAIAEASSASKEPSLPPVSVSAREASAEQLLGALRNVPLLGGRPLVVLRDGEALGKKNMAALAGAIADYVERPVESATLVVVAEKMDGRSRIMQLAAKLGAVVECKKLFENKLPGWIASQVKRRGRQISMQAAGFMAEMVGNDLGQLAQAIDRLVLYIGERRVIELKDVEDAVADTHQRDVFALTDAVGRRRIVTALACLHSLIQAGKPPPLILHMLVRHFRILSKAKEILGRAPGTAEAARYIGVNPYYAKGYLDQAENFSRGELRRSFALLHRCDREIKSSRLPKERVLERAILALAERPAG